MHRAPFHFSSSPSYSHRAARRALTWRVNPFRDGLNGLFALDGASLRSLTAIQIRVPNGSFPQALTLNVNCCLNLWQPVLLPLRSSFDLVFPVGRLSVPPHSDRITTAVHRKSPTISTIQEYWYEVLVQRQRELMRGESSLSPSSRNFELVEFAIIILRMTYERLHNDVCDV